MVLTGRGWGSVTRHEIQKIVHPQLAKVMKNDRTETGDDADGDEIEGPLAGLRQPKRPDLAGNFVEDFRQRCIPHPLLSRTLQFLHALENDVEQFGDILFVEAGKCDP